MTTRFQSKLPIGTPGAAPRIGNPGYVPPLAPMPEPMDEEREAEESAHPADDAPELSPHDQGKMEAVAQALAIIGHVEGEYRGQANGDSRSAAFATAETLRRLGSTLREEIADPQGRSRLEIQARSQEAGELSEYVREVSTHYRNGTHDVHQVLDSIATDISKGSEGVGRLQEASSVKTPAARLRELLFDTDPDVRWWAAQNPHTPEEGLVKAAAAERHATVLAAIVANPHLPPSFVNAFLTHPHHEVRTAAQFRMGVGD